MRYFFAFLAFFVSSQAFACAVDDENSIKKMIYTEVKKVEDSSCHNITLNFPESVPTGDSSIVWADPHILFEINDISLNLRIYNSDKEGYKSVSFCLSEETISKTSIDIVYDAESTKKPPAVLFCRKSITIDNLGKFLAEKDQTKTESEKQKQAE